MNEIDLSGVWEFRLDPQGVGVEDRWYSGTLPDSVVLPGSLDENGIGEPNRDQSDLSGLSRKVRYTGAAWFSVEVEIPVDWQGEFLTLDLERVHWFSDLWVDGVPVGRQDSLSVPHTYVFRALEGFSRLRVTLRVDNTPHIPIGRIGHALTDWTQTNWNGIIGSMVLKRTEPMFDRVRITPLDDAIKVEGTTSNSGQMRLSIPAIGTAPLADFPVSADVPFTFLVERTDMARWCEDSPSLFEVVLELNGNQARWRTGMRSIRRAGKQILLNDEPLFLRGTLECCVFPKTGYPPMTAPEWGEVMRTVKSYGLNHLRFHSWCPPEAAFLAADEFGVLLQVELPVWTGLWPISSDCDLMDFCCREAHRILSTYGHHPSFVMFALGNEIAFYGSEPKVDALLEELKLAYPNRIYTFSSQGTHLSTACDYYVQADNGKPGAENKPLRGSTWFGVGSRFDRETPNTLVTCNEAADQFDRPVISHEVAEWAVFPDVYNADSYDGVLEARNFNTIAQMLESRGMLEQARDFVNASGKLSALLYKEEIETLLRTRGLAGYQLLGLTDFPGQGTATVGMLDAFWQDKGFIDAEAFSRFCASTVPLLRYEKAVWLSDELFVAEALIFHSGSTALSGLSWRAVDVDGRTVESGRLEARSLVDGQATSFGNLCFPLDNLPSPARYAVELTTDAGEVNRWSIWSMPSKSEPLPLPDVFVAPFYRQDVRWALQQGKSVWLRINPKKTWSGIPGRFAPAFWSPIHFKEQVGTMGTLISADHPMFAQFPTENHSDWNWWDILTNSKAIILNDLPPSFRPTLQVIDRYERNHKLGTIFEANVGEGKILVTMIDFDDVEDRPASRQLEHSIRMYLASKAFAPSQTIALADLDQVFIREP